MSLFSTQTYKFMSFCNEFNKDYATMEEFQARFDLWAAADEFITEFNSGNNTHTVGHNMFSDMSAEEVAVMNGFKWEKDAIKVTEKLSLEGAPESVDWVAAGAVTEVKNQGSCGSCWSFSTTGSMEGAHQILTGDLISLSEQQFVECSLFSGNMGCLGGMMDRAFKYAESHSIESEEDYPYKGWAIEMCYSDESKGQVKVTDFTDVTPNDSDALLAAIAKQPVSVAIQANQAVFQHYTGGIITADCGTDLDHGVLAVGYGVDNGTQYIKVKNSWGPTWGEDGYVRIAVTDGAGMCGINSTASYPTTN